MGQNQNRITAEPMRILTESINTKGNDSWGSKALCSQKLQYWTSIAPLILLSCKPVPQSVSLFTATLGLKWAKDVCSQCCENENADTMSDNLAIQHTPGAKSFIWASAASCIRYNVFSTEPFTERKPGWEVERGTKRIRPNVKKAKIE